MDIFKLLFCKDFCLEDLSDIFGYDEDTIIDMLEGKIEMTKEELEVLDGLLKLN